MKSFSGGMFLLELNLNFQLGCEVDGPSWVQGTVNQKRRPEGVAFFDEASNQLLAKCHSEVLRVGSEFLFDAKELIVLGDSVGTAR